jgi:hypothetical protein
MSLPTDHRRLLTKLVRELIRAEARAIDHAEREERRNGNAPPVLALQDVARHALAMRPRLDHALEAHGVEGSTPSQGTTWAAMQWLAIDRVYGGERAFRAGLIDLRHALEVARVLRDAAHLDELFAVIRWCDDWLAERRMLVAHVESHLAWYAQHIQRS